MLSWLKAILLALCSTLLMVSGFAQAELVAVPTLSTRVTDLTQTLSQAEQAQLEQKLAAFEQQKGSQIAVLIVPTTQPEDIAQYSIRVVEAWKLGRKGVGDGVLVLIAKDDHKMRIEVGRGLEGAIPDLYAKRIISEDIAPKFKQGDFVGGLDSGVDKLIGLVNGEALPAPSKAALGGSNSIQGLLPLLLFGGLVSGMMLRGMFGTFLGSAFNGGLLGGIVWMLGLALGGAAILGFIAFFITMMLGSRGFGGMPMGGSSGGWSGSGSSGGSSWGGGGGDFGGGGASGGW